MSMILECKDSGEFKPHPEGIHPAVCLDVIDLGLVKTDFQGQERIVPKVKLVFESEQKTDDGRNCIVSKNFTASLHPKARLAEFIGKWRGCPVRPGDSIDLSKLIGACCTLVISHQQNLVGKTYASLDAVSRPTRKVTPSGHYDPVAARQRIAEWKAKGTGVSATVVQSNSPRATSQSGCRTSSTSSEGGQEAAPARSTAPGSGEGRSKSAVPVTAPADDNIPFDPEVGF